VRWKIALHMEYPQSLRLNRRINLRVKLVLNLLFLSVEYIRKINSR
jgi:hypothetical protein